MTYCGTPQERGAPMSFYYIRGKECEITIEPRPHY